MHRDRFRYMLISESSDEYRNENKLKCEMPERLAAVSFERTLAGLSRETHAQARTDEEARV